MDGALQWQYKNLMGCTNYKAQGYLTGATNYTFGEDIADTKSPFEMAVDYGSATVSSGTITVVNAFRIGQGYVIPEASSVYSIYGWIASSGGYVVTLAMCKVTPVADDTTALVPVVIDEIAVTGLGNNGKLIAINETTITTPTLAAGDIIFPMVKEATAGSTIYFNVNVKTTAY